VINMPRSPVQRTNGRFAGIAAARGLKVEIVKTGSRSLLLVPLPLLSSAPHESVN
jgi:hypothetical protein